MQAPLDYTSNGDPRNASVAVVRYRAGGGKTNRAAVLGSLLLNPGGPGGSGIGFATNRKPQNANRTTAEVFDTLFEGRYDIVSFDPRGVGRTWPGVQCFDRPDALAINEFQSLANGVLGSHTDHATKAEFGTDLAQLSLFSSVCAANATREEQMRYVSTPFVARDMKLLYEALGDTALHYWGFSYGTVLGSVFADMFPQHVGRVAIDGVVDVPAYHEGAWSNNLLDTEDEFRLLFEECVSAGPEACPLAKIVPQGTKASDLHTEVSNWLAQLKSHPIPALQVQPPQLLTFGSVVGQIFTSLYAPVQWPGLVQRLAEAIEGNVTALAEAGAVTLSSKIRLPLVRMVHRTVRLHAATSSTLPARTGASRNTALILIVCCRTARRLVTSGQGWLPSVSAHGACAPKSDTLATSTLPQLSRSCRLATTTTRSPRAGLRT